MSKRICENCKSTNIKRDKYIEDGSDCYVCEDCCRVGTADDFPEYTVFHQITASPEVLAQTLIRLIACEKNPSIKGWTSSVVQRVFKTYGEAYDATVARLKEAAKETKTCKECLHYSIEEADE